MKLMVKQQLLLAFGIVLSVVLLTSSYSYYLSTKVDDQIHRLMTIETPSMKSAFQLEIALLQSLSSLRGYLLLIDIPDKAKGFLSQHGKAWEAIETHLSEIKQLNSTHVSSLDKSDSANQAIDQISTNLQMFKSIQKEIIDSSTGGDSTLPIETLGTKAAPLANLLIEKIDLIQSINDDTMKLEAQSLSSFQDSLRLYLALGSIVSAALAVIIAIKLSTQMSGRIQLLLTQAKAIANGDLSLPLQNISGQDEICILSKQLDVMQANIREMIYELNKTSSSLETSSKQISQLSMESLKRIIDQENETHLVATAMEEMVATINSVSINAGNAASSASNADISAQTGRKTVKQTVVSINGLGDAINNTSQTINLLGQDTAGVDKIVAVISSIADQTNLLALNAAIEAARAGEQGRGFAVVADEVRTLASRTQQSTLEIRTMLDRLKTGVNQAVSVMSDSQIQAKDSVEKSDSTIAALNTIADAVGLIRGMNEEIATAAEQQNITATEMSKNMLNINNGVKSMVINLEKSNISVEHLSELAEELQKIVKKFKVA